MSRRIRAVVVDDEALARVNIRAALAEYPNWQLNAELGSGQALFETLRQQSADVVFLDIHMPGLNGMATARLLSTLPHCPLIIFVTAYDHYAVEAFELFALDYLLKPFDDERFQQCLARAEQALQDGHYRQQQRLWQQHQEQQQHAHQQRGHQAGGHQQAGRLQQLVIRSLGSIRLVPMDEVRWFAASGNYVVRPE